MAHLNSSLSCCVDGMVRDFKSDVLKVLCVPALRNEHQHWPTQGSHPTLSPISLAQLACKLKNRILQSTADKNHHIFMYTGLVRNME